MFESLFQSLNPIFNRLRGKGRLTEGNTREAVREIRTALLEADVNYKVVADFSKRVRDRALGQEVIRSVDPGQQIVKVFHDELIKLMGPVDPAIPFKDGAVTVIMLVGLQGSGKTTTAGKLANRLMGMGHRPLLVAADVQRPAAIEQLRILGEQLKVPVYAEEKGRPPKICRRAVRHALKEGLDVAILDTAGRLHIDGELMAELRDIAKTVRPDQTLFVCDAMTGQDAVTSAAEFNEQLPVDGIILTKLDGDARGGAALSVKAVTGKPIKFVGMGEQLDRLEEFVPERMASRILGMGDVVGLVEKAQAEVDVDKARELERKIGKGKLTLEDFMEQLQRLRRMGPLKELMAMIPGMQDVDLSGAEEGELAHIEAIISSMTPEERRNPDLIDGARRRRVAGGSGTETREVNQLLKQFKQMRKFLRQVAGSKMMPALGGTGAAGGLPGSPGAGMGRVGRAKRRLRRKRKKRRK